MYCCDGKEEFSASITPDFRVKLSFRNHSNILIWWFLVIFSVEKSCADWYFCGDHVTFYIINVFTVTFNQINVSLHNKSHNFFQKKEILLTKVVYAEFNII